jgi:predicted house-cleaning NTP pyrophosphatase (Maf/HAM1 superfamily)
MQSDSKAGGFDAKGMEVQEARECLIRVEDDKHSNGSTSDDKQGNSSVLPSRQNSEDATGEPKTRQRSYTFDGDGIKAPFSIPGPERVSGAQAKQGLVARHSSVEIGFEGRPQLVTRSSQGRILTELLEFDTEGNMSRRKAGGFRPHSPSDEDSRESSPRPSMLIMRRSMENVRRASFKSERGSANHSFAAAAEAAVAAANNAVLEADSHATLLSQARVPKMLDPFGGKLVCPDWPWTARRDVLTYLGWDVAEFLDIADEASLVAREINFEQPLLVAQAQSDAIIRHLDRLASKGKLAAPECFILTADQQVNHNGVLLDKPEDVGRAAEYLAQFSNNSVSTVSALVLTHYPSKRRVEGLEEATIHFLPIPKPIIEQIVRDSPSVLSAAGGLVVASPLMLRFIDRIAGTLDCVLGLPVALVGRLAAELKGILEQSDPLHAEGKTDSELASSTEEAAAGDEKEHK